MTIFEELMGFGLTENEAKVYMAVIELGEPAIGAIEKYASIHKQLIYNAAQKLQEKGLLSVHEIRGRKHFSIENPEAIEEYAAMRLEKAKTLVPLLYQHANQKRSSDTIRVFEGLNGIHQYYIDSIRKEPKSSSVSILGLNNKKYFEIFKQDGVPFIRFENTRRERKIYLNLVLFGTDKDNVISNKQRQFVNMRIFEDGVIGPMDIMIWHNHVGMLFYAATPYVLDILGKDAAQGFLEYFNVFWNRGKNIVSE
jgi:hypothetical protein